MSILKTTLGHLLRRRWKLTLVVVLVGAAMAVVTHTWDIGQVVQEQDAAREALLRGEELPEGGALERARGTVIRAVFGFVSFLFALGVVLVGMLMPGGLVANERRSGTIMLWAQHPMPLTRFYLNRYLGIQAANLAAQALLGITAVLAALPPTGFPATEPGVFVEICLEGTLACAIAFAISALGLRRSAFLALAYYAASGLASGVLVVAGNVAAPADVLTVILNTLPFLIFPSLPINEFVTGFEPGVAWDPGATGMVLYHFALWTAIAWLGLRRIVRKPLKL